MISSMLAFAAGLAAKIKLTPKSNPETASKNDLDLAALLIAARVEMGNALEAQVKAEAEQKEAMRVLAVTRALLDSARRARDDAKAESQALRARVRIVERQRADLVDQIGHILNRERASQDRHAAEIQRLIAMAPMNPGVFAVDPAVVFAGVDPAGPQMQAQSAMRAHDPGHSHGLGGFAIPPDVVGAYQQIPTPLGMMTLDRAMRYVDCTCVPGRSDAFRNQQIQD